MRQLDVYYEGGGYEKEFVYEFNYNYCIYESAASTVSIHRTLLGAYRAMKEHRIKKFWEWRRMPKSYRQDFLDSFAQSWFITKTEILTP